MQYHTVIVSEQSGCCGGNVNLEQAIQQALNQYSSQGWVLITAYQQSVSTCNGNSSEVGAVLIFGRRR